MNVILLFIHRNVMIFVVCSLGIEFVQLNGILCTHFAARSTLSSAIFPTRAGLFFFAVALFRIIKTGYYWENFDLFHCILCFLQVHFAVFYFLQVDLTVVRLKVYFAKGRR